jgi:N-acetylneuraminate lyase
VAYYIPGLSGQKFSLEMLLSLAELKGLCGFKFTDTNFYLMQRLVARLRTGQIVYNGPDEMLALGLQMGAHGGIGTTYNVMPEQFLAIAAHCAAGRSSEAIAVQKQVNDVIEVLLSYQALVATKLVLHWQGLIASPACAPPRAPMTDAQQAELRRRLEATTIGGSMLSVR